MMLLPVMFMIGKMGQDKFRAKETSAVEETRVVSKGNTDIDDALDADDVNSDNEDNQRDNLESIVQLIENDPNTPEQTKKRSRDFLERYSDRRGWEPKITH